MHREGEADATQEELQTTEYSLGISPRDVYEEIMCCLLNSTKCLHLILYHLCRSRIGVMF